MITSTYAIPIWISVIFISSLAVVIFLGNKNFAARAFSFSIFMVAGLTASMGFFLFATDQTLEAWGIRITFFMGNVVATSLLYFIIAFTTNKKPGRFVTSILVLILGAFFYLNFYTDLISGAPIKLASSPIGMTWGWETGPLAFLYGAVILGYYITCAVLLNNARKIADTVSSKRNIIFIMIGLIIGVITTFTFNTFLPYMGIFDYTWIGPTSGIIWVSLIAFSITKYHQLSIKVVATEVLVFIMTIAAFINIFIDRPIDSSGRMLIFGAFVGLGLYMIRSALRQEEQQKQLSELNVDLQVKVDEQIGEIKKSLEVERAARQELQKIDETKNQFILITQHHLRTPITSLKWQLEAISNGTYGPISAELKSPISEMSESIDRLNHLINSLLSISALKSGIETLKKAQMSLKPLVEDVLAELQREIERKGLKVTLPPSKEVWPPIQIDKERMRETLFIIVENAVRYNIEKGSISISGQATESQFILTVENTGQELSTEDKQKIFSELFYRSARAQTAHPMGMGIGLSMAQAVIEAHRGTISINSRKEKGGVRVDIILPYN